MPSWQSCDLAKRKLKRVTNHAEGNGPPHQVNIPIHSQKSRWRRTIPGILISLAALTLVFYFTDMRLLQSTLSGANYGWLPLCVLLFLLSISARAFAWRTLLRGKVGFTRLFFTINVGYLFNNIFPFRLGEVGRALLLNQTTGISFWEVASTILMERAIDILIVAGLILISLPLTLAMVIPGQTLTWAAPLAYTTAALLLLALISLYIIARNRVRLEAWLDRMSVRWPWVGRLAHGRLNAFLDGLDVITDFRQFCLALFFMAMAWILALIENYFNLMIFLSNPAWFMIVFASGIASLGVAVPSSPGGIGVLEASYVGAFALFGIKTAIALAFALLAHSLYYVVTTCLGVYGIMREGETLSHLYHKLIDR